MELYQLKTFVAVAKEGHLTRAANLLHTSQPAVSAHIKALEGELDVKLFERTPKGMVLTSAGTKLQQQAQIILENVNEIKIEAAKAKKAVKGKVQMGLNIDPAFLKLDGLLSYASKKYPGLEFHLIQNMSWEAIQDVQSGSLDCAFVYGPFADGPNEAVDGFLLESFEVVLAAPAKWKKKLKDAEWKDIGELPWIMTPDICRFYRIAKEVFDKEKINPLSVAVADEEITIQRLVLSGAGVTLMIKQEALPLVEEKKLVIWDHTVAELPFYFVYPVKQEQNPKIKAVIETVKAVWKKDQKR